MIYLVFDVETTGMLRKDLPEGDADQPHLVQIGMELCDGDRVLSSVNLLVNPGIDVPEEAFRVHGISTETTRYGGVPKVVAVALFNNMVRLAEVLVAHNAAYDVGVMVGEYRRLGRTPPFGGKSVRCTMTESTDVCKIPGKYRGYKWPSLQEAYAELVDGRGFDGAHDALADVRACRRVFLALEKRRGSS